MQGIQEGQVSEHTAAIKQVSVALVPESVSNQEKFFLLTIIWGDFAHDFEFRIPSYANTDQHQTQNCRANRNQYRPITMRIEVVGNHSRRGFPSGNRSKLLGIH